MCAFSVGLHCVPVGLQWRKALSWKFFLSTTCFNPCTRMRQWTNSGRVCGKQVLLRRNFSRDSKQPKTAGDNNKKEALTWAVHLFTVWQDKCAYIKSGCSTSRLTSNVETKVLNRKRSDKKRSIVLSTHPYEVGENERMKLAKTWVQVRPCCPRNT